MRKGQMTPIALEAFATMERHLREATVDLFASYGMPVRPSGLQPLGAPAVQDQSIVTVIGYVGNGVRGALVLIASRATVENWLMALGGADLTADVCDALGEFANMLLGRLKGRLLPEGFPILLSTPTTTSGGTLRVSRPTAPSALLTFDGPGWTLDVRIDATFDDTFALQARDARETPAEAGDVMLF